LQGHGLVGGGPSIVWTADGSGIVGSRGSAVYDTIPIDGGEVRPGVGQIFDPRGGYGPGLAELRICSPGNNCPNGDDGRIDRIEPDGSTRTIWQQEDDRALAAGFGGREGEYWLTLDHDSGRQVALAHVQDGRQDTVAMVNREAVWQYVAAPYLAPDQSTLLVSIDLGGKFATVLVPRNGAPQTFHSGHFAGFVDSGSSAVFAGGQYGTPVETMSAVGEMYRLPPLDELIAAEFGPNSGRTVLGKASRDAVDGETNVGTIEVLRDHPGTGEVNLVCFGPSSVTVTSGAQSVTNPCLGAGAYGLGIDANGPIVVTASGDTSWRVVVYSP
jgi:hypothetical protein